MSEPLEVNGLPVTKSVADLIKALSQLPPDLLVTRNDAAGITLFDPQTHEYAGWVNVRTTECEVF